MHAQTIVPTLGLLAATAISAQAAVKVNDDVELKMSMRLQTRLELASAKDASGADYDIWEGAATTNAQDVNLMVRRARLYLKGKYQDNTKFNLTLMADEMAANEDRGDTDTHVRYAWVSHSFKSGDIKSTVKAGIDKVRMASAEYDSSSRRLFATGRNPLASGVNSRGMGLAYELKAPLFKVNADYQEMEENGKDNNDVLFTVRVESSLSEEWTMKKRKESFLGKDGFEHVAGLGFASKTDGSDDNDDWTAINLDYNVHWNQLSANVDLVTASDYKGKGTDSLAISAQAGWAIPMDDMIVEPALRIAIVDNDTDNDDENGVYDEEGGASGTYFDLGANIYFDGHNNKLQISYTNYTPEDGDGDAGIFRVQHQLNF